MIYLNDLNKQFGAKVLLKDVNLHIRPNETVGLIGENGTGKTTLFRIIMQKEQADSGRVTLRKGARVALLEQELGDDEGSVLERVVSGDPHFQSVRQEMQRLETDLHQPEAPESKTQRYGELQHEFERLGGYEREPEARSILCGLGFREDQIEKPLAEFSGGWRMRAEMARLLLMNPDVLLLDEPTNHFDLKSVV